MEYSQNIYYKKPLTSIYTAYFETSTHKAINFN